MGSSSTGRGPIAAVVLAFATSACCSAAGRDVDGLVAPQKVTLTSPAFPPDGDIPSRFTCDGDGISPPLTWSNVDAKTQTFALVVDDPDAPDATFVHWIVYNVPNTVSALAEGASGVALPTGAREGMNDFGDVGYGGPCPPCDVHRYVFKLYELDASLPDLGGPAKDDLSNAMNGHVLGMGVLTGHYER
jgi:Raf kinase inhibitor-like YbhB/YbcL family protein